VANATSGTPSPNASPDGDAIQRISDILEGITGVQDRERFERLRVALEVVRQQAHTLSEEITSEMKRLGLPLPNDTVES
jgi:hypothetical protein